MYRYGFVSNLRYETDIELVAQLTHEGISRQDPQKVTAMSPFIASETRGRMPNGQIISGYFALVPLTGEQMLNLPRQEVTDRIVQAIRLLADCGCAIVGLGAFTGSALTAGGKRLRGRVDCALTTGNAYTVNITLETISDVVVTKMRRCVEDQHYAIVGATGSVGNAIARSLAGMIGELGSLTLIARNPGKIGLLEAQCRNTSSYPHRISGSTEIGAMINANVVIVTTSANGFIIRDEHVSSGTVIIDDTQPRNTHPELRRRKDVLVIDGGYIATPDIDFGMDVGAPPGEIFACWAETMMLAAEGHSTDFYLGDVHLEAVNHVNGLAQKYGLGPAPYRSFGELMSPVVFDKFQLRDFGRAELPKLTDAHLSVQEEDSC